jgi:uncharacterized membrane protein
VTASDVTRSRESSHLRRLEVLVDCFYALVIVICVAGLPMPRDVGWTEGDAWDFLARYGNDYLVGALGLVLVVSYWLQNVAVLGSLQRSDGRHAMLVLVQLVFLLFYLVGVGLGVDFEMHLSTLLLQSASLLLMGIVAMIAWAYASRDRRLLAEHVTDAEIQDLRRGMIPEPATCALTLLAAPLGTGAWEAAWFLFPLLSWYLKRRKRRAVAQV